MIPSDKRFTLLKWLTRNTHFSRRKSFDAIVSGQVKINGVVTRDTGVTIHPANDNITINGKLLRKSPPALIYILLNKPKGVVTSIHDPEGRTTVIDLIKKIKTPVFPVGRLDIMTEGILLLTNDGTLANTLLHPRFSVPRTYHAKVKGKVFPEVFEHLRRGTIKLDGRPIRPIEIETLKSLKKNSWLKVTIREGRNREVRRMLGKLNLPVLNLIRVGFGPLNCNGLKPGQWRQLTETEVRRLQEINRFKKGKFGNG